MYAWVSDDDVCSRVKMHWRLFSAIMQLLLLHRHLLKFKYNVNYFFSVLQLKKWWYHKKKEICMNEFFNILFSLALWFRFFCALFLTSTCSQCIPNDMNVNVGSDQSSPLTSTSKQRETRLGEAHFTVTENEYKWQPL